MNAGAPIGKRIQSEGLYEIRPQLWLKDLVVNYSIIVSCFVFFNQVQSMLVLPLVSLIVGARLHALALLGHDATHRLAFRTRWFNDLICNLFIAWPLGVVMTEGYRPWHFHHHRVLGTDEDPELSYRGLAPYTGTTTLVKAVFYFFFDLSGLGVGGLFRFMKAIFPYQKPLTMLGPVIFWIAFATVCFSLGAMWIFFLWAFSIVSGFWAVFRFRTWTEHVAVENQGVESSHRFSAGPLARFFFFPHNTYCHYEHHKWPQVPYYHLPRLREILLDRKPIVTLSSLFESPIPSTVPDTALSRSR